MEANRLLNKVIFQDSSWSHQCALNQQKNPVATRAILDTIQSRHLRIKSSQTNKTNAKIPSIATPFSQIQSNCKRQQNNRVQCHDKRNELLGAVCGVNWVSCHFHWLLNPRCDWPINCNLMVIQLNAVHCGRNPEGKHGNMAMDEPPVGSNWIQLKAKGRTKDLLGSGNAATRRGMNEKPWNLQVNFGDGLLIRPWKIRFPFFFFFSLAAVEVVDGDLLLWLLISVSVA